jgi:hypothetical protein
MAGEEDLSKLIKSMSPSLDDEIFIFGHIPAKSASTLHDAATLLAGKSTQMMLWESEGWTVIMPEKEAEKGSFQAIFPCKKITLNVHSSLDAVGFLAAITSKLTQLKIGVNPVSGFFHDHLFVPVGKESAVMEALRDMVEEANHGKDTKLPLWP